MTVSNGITTGKSRVLVVGATGFIGRFVTEASLASGRPTYVLVRPSPGSSCNKAKIVEAFKDKGAFLLRVRCTWFSWLFLFIFAWDFETFFK